MVLSPGPHVYCDGNKKNCAATAIRDKDGGAETVLEGRRVSMVEASLQNKKKKDFPGSGRINSTGKNLHADTHTQKRFKCVSKVVGSKPLLDHVCHQRALRSQG